MPARSLTIRIGAAAATLTAGLALLVGATAASPQTTPAHVADSSWGIVPPSSTPSPTVTPLALADDSSWG
ncbi:hypothetical protein ACFVX9_17780 [Kitasatospora sp. NPDC058243]|uniref:hypothetical protein n=1 Tax=Kitasatospora sp. NPDC058243 TaxID=3346397 RepID=UPI0036DCB48D